MGLQNLTHPFERNVKMDDYKVMEEFLQELGRVVLYVLALLFVGIALGLLLTKAGAADFFVWLVEQAL